ncbi:polyprenyl synthetase family protein [Ramlibacter pallidus]|uniref:Polyprenyl synthetase family protein n=1 Tax=Ramlibacter pallidus TaxID=2780087 RepID=A0ABR9S709_9BURK|nr:polyprenyl synthetase family protein [Ramlibacter pallidus]MBE7369224.1 polyprenyl synthetase family protein [Ramlibacter pallidus]
MSTAFQPDDALAQWRRAVERRLAALLPAEAAGVAGAMQAAVLTPGKRLRPLLVLAVGEALGARGPGLLDFACAVEMIHCASLVLDDMPAMDDARLRRGQPTVHLRFGEDVAMLAAVALVSEACRVAASAPALRAPARARAVQVLCEAVGPLGLVRGQYRDLHEGAGARSAAAAAETNDQKTGVLFAAALELSACAAGRARAVPDLRRAALAIGQAFQLRDDLEDLLPAGEGREDPLQDAGKSTVVQLLGADAVRRSVDAHLGQARQALRSALGRDDALLTGLLRRAFPETPQPLAADFPDRAVPAWHRVGDVPLSVAT